MTTAFDRGEHQAWVKAHLDMAERDVANLDLDPWFRLAQLGLTRTRANGHASFQRGELANLLGIASNNVSREIRSAVRREFLMPDSSTQCLVLNQGRYDTAGLKRRGKVSEECAFHAQKIQREADRMIARAEAQHHHRTMVSPSCRDGVQLVDQR